MLAPADCDKRGIRFFVDIPHRFYTSQRVICFLGHTLVQAYHNNGNYSDSEYILISDDIMVRDVVLTKIVQTIELENSIRFDVHVEAVQSNNKILFEKIIDVRNVVKNSTLSRIAQHRKLAEQHEKRYVAENTNHRMVELDNTMRNRRAHDHKIKLERAEKEAEEAKRQADRMEAIIKLETQMAENRQSRLKTYLAQRNRPF